MSRRRGAALGGVCLAALLLCVPDASRAQDGYSVEIWKHAHRLELWRDGELLRQMDVALGLNAVGDKVRQGDKRTPVGRYFVSEKHVSGRFYRFLGLSYPNIEDANRGYEEGLITARQWADIFVSVASDRAPTSSTKLGGRIGIHGYGRRPYIPAIDWTDGCIAVSNEEAKSLYELLPIGTAVTIYD